MQAAEPASAQTGCETDNGDPIACSVPLMWKPPFAADWFAITAVDEATNAISPFHSGSAALVRQLKVEVVSPAGATISSDRGSGSQANDRCAAEDASECLLFQLGGHQGFRIRWYSPNPPIVPLRVSAPDGTTEVELRATLLRQDVADPVTKTFSMPWSDSDGLVVETFPGYDFARVNGGGPRIFERDQLQVWVGASSLAFGTGRFESFNQSGLNGAGQPVFEISAPAGTQIWTDQLGSTTCGRTRDRFAYAAGWNRCHIVPSRITVNTGAAHWGREWAFGGGVFVQPPTSGSGTFDLTVTWRLADGRVLSESKPIRYGPTAPADLGAPYPIARVSGPSPGSRFEYSEAIHWRATGIDGRDGSALPLTGRAFSQLRVSWFDTAADGSEADARLLVYRDLHASAANEQALGPAEIRAQLGGAAVWGAALSGTALAPHGTGGGMRGRFELRGPAIIGGRTGIRGNWARAYSEPVWSRAALGDYAYLAPRVASGPEVRAVLPQDSDQRLAPGATEPVEAGLGATASGRGVARTRLLDARHTRPCIHHRSTEGQDQPPPPTWDDPSTTAVIRVSRDWTIPFEDTCMWNDIVDGGESYLLLQGPATWEDGGKRLRVGTGTAYPVFACSSVYEDLSFICSMRSERGQFPRLVADADAEAGATVTLSANITHVDRDEQHPGWVAGLPEMTWSRVGETPDDPEVWQVSWLGETPPADRRHQSIFGSVEFTIGRAGDLDLAALEPVDADAGAAVRAGGKLPLRLKILNSDEGASPASAIQSIALIAEGGGTIAGEYCAAGRSCWMGIRAEPLAYADDQTVSRISARIGGTPIIVSETSHYSIFVEPAGADETFEISFSGEELLATRAEPIGVDIAGFRGGGLPRVAPLRFRHGDYDVNWYYSLLRDENGELHIGTSHRSATATVDMRIVERDLEAEAADLPSRMGDIRLTYSAPALAGPASVSASIVGKDGRVLRMSLPITVSGPASALAVTGGGIALNHGVEGDTDELAFSVSARDSAGRDAALPLDAHIGRIAGPDGEVLESGITAAFTCSDQARFKCELKLTVTAPSSSPLAVGGYAAHLSGGALSGRAEFALAGPANSIALSGIPAEFEIGGSFAVAALVTDAGGNPAADGTPLAFSVAEGPGSAIALMLAEPADGAAKTVNGEAGVRLVAISRRIGVLKVTAGRAGPPDASVVRVLDLREAEAGLRMPALTTGFSTYSGAATSASDLIAAQPEIAAINLWNGVEWVGFAPDVPGARDFRIQPGDVVYIAES